MKAFLCRDHGSAEVELALSTNKKLSTMNILCCQMSQTTKDAVRVTGHGCQANAMPITQSLMQAYRSVNSVYKTHRTREEKVKKAKEQRLKDRGEEEAKEQKEAIMSMEKKRRRLEDREKSVSKEQKKCKEQVAEGLYDEASRRLKKAIVDRNIRQRSLLFKSW